MHLFRLNKQLKEESLLLLSIVKSIRLSHTHAGIPVFSELTPTQPADTGQLYFS